MRFGVYDRRLLILRDVISSVILAGLYKIALLTTNKFDLARDYSLKQTTGWLLGFACYVPALRQKKYIITDHDDFLADPDPALPCYGCRKIPTIGMSQKLKSVQQW